MRAGGDWWLQASEHVSDISHRCVGPIRSACYRFGDLFLDIHSNYSPVLDYLQLWYGECAVSEPTSPDGAVARWSIRAIDHPPLALVSFQRPESPDHAATALSVFRQLYRSQHVAVTSAVPEWHLIYSSASATRPFMASRGFDALIDLAQEPPRFLVNYLVSAMISLQQELLFVHAASVGIQDMGVLLWGYSGAGKTTTSLALASRGHVFFGDNMACIRIRSRELLPFRRVAAIKPGPRAPAVNALLQENTYETVDLPDGKSSVLMQVGHCFPASQADAMPLSSVFYLRRFADQPALEAFTPTATDGAFLGRLSRDPMAVFGVSPARRMMNVFVLLEVLSKVRCYYLDLGMPEETAELIEKTMEEL